MKIHSEKIIRKIKELRRQGFSIQQIMFLMSLPKTTVWNYIQDVSLTEEQKAILRTNQGGSTKRRENAIEEAENLASDLLKSKKRESVIIISMLYWAEGHKKNTCSFTNTDMLMISVYLKILRDSLKIPKDRIEITIRIFTGMNRVSCLSYWSSVTGVPKENIRVRFNDGGSSGKTTYGICRVTVIKGHMILKLMHALVGKISKNVLD
ncbi:MAG: hypothetical protein WCJ74_00865 [bacterium]